MAVNPPKQDFSGKAKTSKTYDKDWVFDKHQGAWVTQKQAKKAKSDRQDTNRVKAELAGNQPAAQTTASTVTVPIPTTSNSTVTRTTAPVGASTPEVFPETAGGKDVLLGGSTSATPTTPSPSVAGGQPPAWWIPTAYSNPNSEQSFANAANAILPTLSPEDQRTVANYLATNYSDVYGKYANAQFAPIPTELTGERQQYLNPARAQAALDILDKVKTAAGGTPGKGYEYLKNALNLIGQYSNNGSPMTREQYEQFAAAVKSMTAQAGNDLSAYSNLAQLFNLPSFTAGALVSNAANTRLNV